MEKVASAEQIKAYEKNLIEEIGIPSLLLMERAALHLYEAVCRMLHAFPDKRKKRILILCGSGNNGADGLALARFLTERDDISLRLCCTGNPDHATDEWKTQAGILSKLGIGIGGFPDPLPEFDIAVDAMLGIGLSRPLDERYQDLIGQLNERRRECDCRILSVDIPTGLHTDRGLPLPVAVTADETVTFSAIKRGLIVNKGRHYSGSILCRPIGTDIESGEVLMHWEEMKKELPARDPLGHKGSFGKVLCITGSVEMPGAAVLNAQAALKSGAGMVKIITPSANRDLLIKAVPEAMFVPAECDDARLRKELDWADVLVLGCGLGKETASAWLSKKAVREWPHPLVIDADGLNALAEDPAFLEERAKINAPTVLTPHPGEFARLFPEEKEFLQDADRLRTLAARCGCILTAKSATTMAADAKRVYYNTEGNDGMATAGSGDVLAGISGALLCVCPDPLIAAALAVSMHAHCGELAAARYGKAGVTATSLIEALTA
ncbi:MAG: NAD(P)H-hydrate dehydratase [Lachnospiraceae bacterium]|nr:NAD(P)H-hydrate dehydratase [Lachnospiraceae bacterium]